MQKKLVEVLRIITHVLNHGCGLSLADVERLGEDPSLERINALMTHNGLLNNETAGMPGIVSWNFKDEVLSWVTGTGRLTIKAYYDSVVVETHAGPREERDAEMALSVQYLIGDYKPGQEFEVEAVIIYKNDELIQEKEGRLSRLIEIDQRIQGNPLWETLSQKDPTYVLRVAYQNVHMNNRIYRMMEEIKHLSGRYDIGGEKVIKAVDAAIETWQAEVNAPRKAKGWRRVNRQVMEEMPTVVGIINEED